MLMFARPDTSQAVSAFSSHQLAEAVQQAAEASFSEAGARLTIELPEKPLPLLGNQHALCGALMNLLQNSLQAVGQGAKVRLAMAVSGDNSSLLIISVCDNGPGVPPQLLPDLFEPFITGRPEGNGLGLAVVQAVAASHQGTVAYQRAEKGGACFTLSLPIHQSEPNGEPL